MGTFCFLFFYSKITDLIKAKKDRQFCIINQQYILLLIIPSNMIKLSEQNTI